MRVLMDTGPWVALIDRSEASHTECVNWFKDFTGEIFSTEAVLTEVMYLLNFSSDAQEAALDFVLEGAITLVPSNPTSLLEAKRLIKKYDDLPMDFADATLVCLAQDLSVPEIVTLDKKGFGVYRLKGGKPFVILP
jgi:predicted nucleic acid-binding protein